VLFGHASCGAHGHFLEKVFGLFVVGRLGITVDLVVGHDSDVSAAYMYNISSRKDEALKGNDFRGQTYHRVNVRPYPVPRPQNLESMRRRSE